MNPWLAFALQVLSSTHGVQTEANIATRLSEERHEETTVTRRSPERHEDRGDRSVTVNSDGVLRIERKTQTMQRGAPRQRKQVALAAESQVETETESSLGTSKGDKTSQAETTVAKRTLGPTSEPIPRSTSSVDARPKERRGRFAWGLGIGGGASLISGYVFIKVAIANANAPKEPQTPEHILGGIGTFLAACLMGIVNNNAYGIVMGASQSLAGIFSQQDLVTLFPTLMLGACLTVTILNGAYFVQIPFRARIIALLLMLSVSYMALGMSTQNGSRGSFVIALLASMGIGASTSLGELCCLSFLRSFPPIALGGWGAGTGLAGIFGSATYLGLDSLNVSISHIFYLMAPTGLVYWWAFEYLDSKLQKSRTLFADSNEPPVEEAGSTLTWERLIKVWKTSSGILFVMVSIYFLEYLIYPGLVDRDTLCPEGTSWLGRHAFTVGWIAYNIGVTLSRGSIAFFKIERLWILVLLQLANCGLWALEATNHYLLHLFGNTGYVIVILWIIWVGIMGGCAYVNCMHAYMTQESIPNDLRELSITVGFALSNVGILLATSSAGVLDNTVLSAKAMFPEGCGHIIG